MSLDIRSQSFGRMDPPARSAVQVARLGPLLLGREPGLTHRLTEGLIVFVFRVPDIEYWEVRGATPSSAMPHDLIRAIAAFGAQPEAILFPFVYLEKDAQGRRTAAGIRMVAECRGRRAEVVLSYDHAGNPLDTTMEPRKLGKVQRGWIGVAPPPELRIEAIGPVGMRPEPRDA